MPMIELNGQTVAIDALGDPQLTELEKRLSETSNPQTCISHIEQFLYKHLYRM